MTHATAMKEYAVERYLLGELPENEQDAFEQHYFECRECADDLRAASVFLENLKQVAVEPVPARRPEPQRDWFAWLRWATLQPVLTGLLLVMLGYQSLYRIPNLERTAAAPVTPAHVDFGVRGEGDVIRLQSGELLQLETNLTPSLWAPRYRVEIRPASGGKALEFEIDGPPRERLAGFKFKVPQVVGPGDYVLTLHWPPDKSESTRLRVETQ